MKNKNHESSREQDLIRKNQRMGLIVMAVVVGMVGMSFAAVPLYSLFCRVTGFGGTTQVAQSLPDHILDREVIIKFNASTARDMIWKFSPEQREITVKLGQKGLTAYSAYNPSDNSTVGTAIYNVTPLKAGKYFHKIQCFCFDEQVLEARQHASMPVMFYVDPSMDDDPDMRDVHSITLSYTFFNAESSALESAMEGFYNQNSGDIKTTN